VAYSWSKEQVPRPEYAHHPTLSRTFMNRRAAWRAAVEWDAKNVLVSWLGRSVPHLTVRYESFVNSPEPALSQILELVGDKLPTEQPGRPLSTDAYESRPHHTLGGNRIRFERGRIPVREDAQWRTAMRRRERVVVSALTLPLLIAYGYAPSFGVRRGHSPGPRK
jgi:hypothetical protein